MAAAVVLLAGAGGAFAATSSSGDSKPQPTGSSAFYAEQAEANPAPARPPACLPATERALDELQGLDSRLKVGLNVGGLHRTCR